MRKLTLLLTLIFFSVMFSPSTSFAEWEKVSENVYGTTYVDFERIRKHDGYVYFWYLIDYVKPNEYGNLSDINITQGDCKVFRLKFLSYFPHKEPMGRDPVPPEEPPERYKDWFYPPPDSIVEGLLKIVCQHTR